MIYIVCFGISTLFAYFANRTKSRKAFILLSVMSILVTAALAGLRDYSIGIDTNHYLTMARFWKGAASRPTLSAYMIYYNGLNLKEPLFALFLGVIEHFTGNYSLFLFAAHTVIIGGIYIGAFRFRRHVNPTLVILLFYLLYFNYSLNGLRQYMAMAVVFAALADLEQRKYLRFVVVVMIARYIHTSALLALGALLLQWIINGRFSWIAYSLRPSVKARSIVIVGGLSLIVLLFPLLCRLLIDLGILPQKYAFYLDPEKIEYNIVSTLFLLVELAVLFVFRRQMRSTTPYYNYFLISSVSFFILQQLNAVMAYGKRVAAFYSLANLVTIALIPKAFRRRENKIIAVLLIVAVASFYWWYVYVLRNGSQTYPYVSVLQSM